MRFFVDMPLSSKLAAWLRNLGHDVVQANDLAMNAASDTAILQFATAQSRAIITADLDFPRLFSLMGSVGPGLILLRGGQYSDLESIECVGRVLRSVPPDQGAQAIVVVDLERIRVRRLPVM